MGQRKQEQSISNYCHAQPQLQGLAGGAQYKTNQELGNESKLSMSALKPDPMTLLCQSQNGFSMILPWQQNLKIRCYLHQTYTTQWREDH